MPRDEPPALGVVGTAVIDEIFPYAGGARTAARPPVRSMGGIFYSLHALAALAPHPSQVVPALRLGADAASLVRAALAALGFDLRFLHSSSVRQNRVELRYTSAERRREVLRGGVPPLTARELAPLLEEVDALYLNFVAGNEVSLPTLRRVRASFGGSIYVDLHSLLLGRRPDGLRFPRPLARWREWVACCDILQCNEDEAALLAGRPSGGSLPVSALERFVREVLGLGPRLLVLTAGPRAVRAWTSGGAHWRLRPPRPARRGDPTGCGDVLGGAFCALHVLKGLPPRAALRRAVEAASWAAGRLGTEELAAGLRAWYLERHA